MAAIPSKRKSGYPSRILDKPACRRATKQSISRERTLLRNIKCPRTRDSLKAKAFEMKAMPKSVLCLKAALPVVSRNDVFFLQIQFAQEVSFFLAEG